MAYIFLNVRHVARGHMGATTLGHGHLASCHVASCHLDKTVKYDILAPLEMKANKYCVVIVSRDCAGAQLLDQPLHCML